VLLTGVTAVVRSHSLS